MSLNQFLNKLNSRPVKLGEEIYSASGFLQEFGQFGDEELMITVKSFKMVASLKGWVTQNGRRVLFAEISGKTIWFDAAGFDLDMVIAGFSLIDPETFQVIYSDTILNPKNIGTVDPLRVTYTADIQME